MLKAVMLLCLFAFTSFSVWAQTSESGLPVIKINTQNGVEIESREIYVNMTFSLTDPNNPRNNVTKTNMKDLIRGRGNDSWANPNAHKKSYRIKFDKKTILFGLEAAKSWNMIAQYRDPTLLFNVVAFELGNRFALPFNHSFHFVELYLNGEYKGNYLLTEHNQVGAGRVDIDENEGWLVELDQYYDTEPKFMTTNYDIPVMIKSPEFEPADISNPMCDFVRNEINALTHAVASPDFPENGYRNLINISTFIDFIMINEITNNKEIVSPGSIYMHKDKDDLINMGPLWDFDSGYGFLPDFFLSNISGEYFYHYPDTKTPLHDFFSKLFEDPIFLAKYKERWNEKYDDIISIPDFIDEMANKLKRSAEQNFQTWWYRTHAPWTDTNTAEPNDYLASVSALKNYYNTRIDYLNNELNKVEVLPANKDFGTVNAGYSEIPSQTFSFVAYGDMSELKVSLGKGNLSDFEIIMELSETNATGGGGFLTSISIKPKKSLPKATYSDVLILNGRNQGKDFVLEIPLNFTVGDEIQQQIYPNPTTGVVYVEIESNIKAYNVYGAFLLENFGYQIDLSNYPKGIYLLKVGDKWVKIIKI